MSKKLLSIILILFGLFFSFVSLYIIQNDLSPSDQKAEVIPVKTKKWNPGHYLQGANSLTPAYITENLNADTSANLKGIRAPLFWGEWETSKDVYDFRIIDSYINALPPNKRIIIMVGERDYWRNYCNEGARLPRYIMDRNQPHPALTLEGTGCVSQFWESDIQERWIKALRELAKHVDENPRVEAIIFHETAFGVPQGYSGTDADFKRVTRDAYINIHKGISSAFQKTNVFQQMNFLGPGCSYLDTIAAELEKIGHGLSNPDSPPEDSLPWPCERSAAEYQSFYNLSSGANPKVIYAMYRKYKGRMPIMVGGDTSQFGDPERPKMFNGEPLNYDNLVKYLYLNAVRGYTYTRSNPPTQVDTYGANYMLWNSHFNSIEAQRQYTDNPIPPGTYTTRYKQAYARLLSDTSKTTISNCPSNIRCIGSVNPTNTPDVATNTPTPIQSATATPRQSATPTPGSSPTPTLRASSTPIPSPTPEITYDVTQTMTPTPPLTGNICGKADVDGDERFNIADFAEFAKRYGTGRNTCADKDVDYGACGGRDVNRDGKLNIADFGGAGIGFAQRYYPKTSCAL